ncbi:MAG: hypothetical protein AB7F43_12320 [Bacteriovoracia bacterium]
MKSLLLILTLLLLNTTTVFGHGASEGAASVGKDKAVTEADEENGFKLSDKASANLNVKFSAIGKELKASTFSLPSQAIVYIQDEAGVYVRKAGWIKRVEGKILQKFKDQVHFQSKDLVSGAEVAVSGVPLLRVTEMEIFGGSHDDDDGEEEQDEHGHAHDEHEKGEDQ